MAARWPSVTSGRLNVNEWLVREGLAVVYRKYSIEYAAAEAAAKAAGNGVWRGDFVMPWDWRRGKRLPSE